MASEKKAILATLAYHDIFDYPLTQKEILKFLVANSKVKRQKAKLQLKSQNLESILGQLSSRKVIDYRVPFYFLKGRDRIVGLRKKRKKYSQEKLKIAQKITQILAKIPFARTIAITGALAMENSDKDDDIDFLIITEKDRLWLTRLIATVVLEILGKRRRPHNKKFKDKICLNMFLDEFTLSLPKAKCNLFTAHEVVQIKPLYNRNQTYEKFLEANEWVRQHLPNAVKSQIPNPKSQIHNLNLKTKRPYILDTIYCILDLLEKVAYHFQLKYMQSKKTTEQVSPHLAFFHPRNIGREVLRKYKDKFSMLQ